MHKTVAEIYAAHTDKPSKKGIEISKMNPLDAALYLAKKNKMRNRPTVIDNIWFQSKAEARFYSELKIQLRAGKIKEFKRQVIFPIVVNGVKVNKYTCDFMTLNNDGTHTVIDVKGIITEAYRIRRSLMLAIYGVTIREIKIV